MALPGLAAAQAPIGIQVELGSGPSLSLPKALEGAVSDFFGPPQDRLGFALNATDVFGSTDGRIFTGGLSYAISLRFSQEVAHYAPASIGWDVTFSTGRATVDLPDGAPPFVDPISIRFDYVAIVPRVFSSTEGTWSNIGTIGARFGVGSELTRVKTHITSALLDVNSERFLRTDFAFLEGYYQPEFWDATELTLGVSYAANKSIAFDFGAAYAF